MKGKDFKVNCGINVYHIQSCGGLAEEKEPNKWINHKKHIHKNTEGREEVFYSLRKGFTYSFLFYKKKSELNYLWIEFKLEYNDEEDLVFVEKGASRVIIKPKNELDEYFFLKFKLNQEQINNLKKWEKVCFFSGAEEKKKYKITKDKTNNGYYPIKIHSSYVSSFKCEGCVKKNDDYDDVVSWEGHSLNENEEEGLKFYFLDKNLYRFSFDYRPRKITVFSDLVGEHFVVDLVNINEKESLACDTDKRILFFKNDEYFFFKIKKETNDLLCQGNIFFVPFSVNNTLDNQTTNTKKNIQQKPNRLGWNLLFFLLVLIVIIIVIVGVVFFLTKIKKKKDFEKN